MQGKAPFPGGNGARDGNVRVGLVGHGIQRSRTPGMHVAEGRAQGLTYRYDVIDPEADQDNRSLANIVAEAEAAGFAGLNVTYPFKQAAVDLVDHMSDAATRVGAINTLVFRNGHRFGHNTDFWGFSEGLRQGLPNASLSSVLLIGAGGAGGAVAHALQNLGAADLMIIDRRPDAADALAHAVNVVAGHDAARAVTDISEAAAAASGIVNATPMGMAKLPGTPINMAHVTPDHWVADIVYFPLDTAFLRGASEKGCRTLNGSGMAVFQAVRAFQLFTGLDADAARMRATFETLGAT